VRLMSHCYIKASNACVYAAIDVLFGSRRPMRKDQPLVRLVFFYLLPRACAGSCGFLRSFIPCIPSRFGRDFLSDRHYSLEPQPAVLVEVRMLVFLFLANSIDYMWTNQCSLIGELVGGGNRIITRYRAEYSTGVMHNTGIDFCLR
jgi:hypothetical protein